MKRKKTPTTTEADVLDKSGRRCCICYALNGSFRVRKGQVAHLDHNPSNFRFDNLCFLCQSHHDDYDTKRRQTKGLTIKEVKKYRSRLYETVAEWRDYMGTISTASMLSFFERTAEYVDITEQGTRIVEGQEGLRITDKDPKKKSNIPGINLHIQFENNQVNLNGSRCLHLTVSLPMGLAIHAEVYANDDWTVSGFMNVLHKNGDIWLLRGQSLESREDDPVFQPRDTLLVYRKSSGENRLVISTHALSGSAIQVHARFSDRIGKELADYLDTSGFTRHFGNS